MALTLQQLYSRTPNDRKASARFVKLEKSKTGRYGKGPNEGQAFIAARTYSTHILGKDGRARPIATAHRNVYTTIIRFTDAKLHTVCSCSCPDHMYRAEFALWTTDNAEITYSNGEFPTTTNPTLKQYYLCKHLCKLYEVIKSRLPSK